MGDANSSNLVCRRKFAELLRHFLSGRITNFEYIDGFDSLEEAYGRDPAVYAVFVAVWPLYDDLWKHRMTDPDYRPLAENRRRFAKWIVFLRSGAPLSPDTGFGRPAPRESKIAEKPSWWSAFNRWRSSRTMLILGLILVCTLFALTGHGYASLAILSVWVGFFWLTRNGISLEPGVVHRAWADNPTDPWPFSSQQELADAVSRPRYLRGLS